MRRFAEYVENQDNLAGAIVHGGALSQWRKEHGYGGDNHFTKGDEVMSTHGNVGVVVQNVPKSQSLDDCEMWVEIPGAGKHKFPCKMWKKHKPEREIEFDLR